MAVIESLEVGIQGKSDSANKSLDDLVRRLGLVAEGISAIGQNKGLDNFAKKVIEATKGLANVQNVAKGISANIEPQVQKISRTFEEVAEKFKDIGKGFKISGGTTSSIQKQIDSYQNALESAKLKEQELSAKGKTDTKGYEDAVAEIQKYSNVIESLTAQLQEMQSTAQNMESINLHLMSDENKQTLEELQSSLEGLRTALQPGSEYKPFAEIQYGLEELRERFPDAAEWAKVFEKSISQIGGISPELKTSTKEVKISIESAKERMEAFQNALNQLAVPEIRDDNINKLRTGFDKAEETIERLRVKLENGIIMGRISENVDDSSFRNLQEQIAIAEKTAEALRKKISEVESAASGNMVSKFGSKLSGLPIIGKRVNSALSVILSAFSKLNNGIKSVAPRITGFGKSLLGLGSSAKKINGSFSGGLKTLLKYGIGIRSLYALMNKLRSAIKEGMRNLVQYSSEVNGSVSLLNNSITQSKNAFAAAAAPILNAFAPALNQIIQLCIKAANAVNQLLSALTGNSTWIKAKTLTDSYADSVKKAEKAAKGALRPFDELKTISMQDNSGNGTAAEDMFETVPIENKFSEMAEKIKKIAERLFDPIKKIIQDFAIGDFFQAGKDTSALVAGIFNFFAEAIDRVDWYGIGQKIGDFLAGIDWIEVLKSVGNLIWEALESALELWEGVFDSAPIETAIISALAIAKWTGLSQSISKSMFGALAKQGITLKNIGIVLGVTILAIEIIDASRPDLVDLGKKITEMITGKEIDIDIFNSLVKGSSFDVDLSVKELFKKWWDNLVTGSLLIEEDRNLMQKVLDHYFGEGTFDISTYFDFGKSWEKVKENWEKFVIPFIKWVSEDGANVVSGFLGGIKYAFSGIGNWLNENIFTPFVEAFKSLFGIHSPSTVMEKQGSFLMEGLFLGVSSWKEKIVSIFESLKDLIKIPINAIIGFMNGLIDGVVSGINGMINALNALSFDVPDWGPLIGGKTFGFSIPNISIPQIPMLANGAVLPGGNPFLAIVNDQKRGQTNVEAPLKVIQEALREELEKFSAKVQVAMPNTRLLSYNYEPAPVPSIAGAYGNYRYDASAYTESGFNGRNSGLLGMSETESYNLIYNAVKAAIHNEQSRNNERPIQLEVDLDGQKIFDKVYSINQKNASHSMRAFVAEDYRGYYAPAPWISGR